MGNQEPILGGTVIPARTRGDEALERNEGEDGSETFSLLTELADLLFDNFEEFILKGEGELEKLFTQVREHGVLLSRT